MQDPEFVAVRLCDVDDRHTYEIIESKARQRNILLKLRPQSS